MRRFSKRAKTTQARGIEEIRERELGEVLPRTFANRLGASEDLVLRLEMHVKLEKHRGCVNTVSFNAAGDILVSGSDDRLVILWNWDAKLAKLAFHSGHTNNVFQAKIMPFSDDRKIVTCAADGQVRYAQISEGGKVETKILARHRRRTHKLAIDPGSPHILYSCGEDGLVQHLDLRNSSVTKLFTCTSSFCDKSNDIVSLNTIAIDPRNPNILAAGGSDEFARVFDIRKYKWDGTSDQGLLVDCFCPKHLIGCDSIGITGLAYSDQSELLVSYNDEFIYLFPKEIGLGTDPGSASPPSQCDELGPQVYKGHQNVNTVKGVSFFGPNSEYVTSGSDCGRIFIWKKKGGGLLRAIKGDKQVVNCTEAHPHAPVLASSGIEENIKIWTPKASEPASHPPDLEEMDTSDGSMGYFLRAFIDSDDEGGTYSDDDSDHDSPNVPEQCKVA